MCSVTLAFAAVSTLMQVQAAGDQADFEQGKSDYNARVTENAAQQTVNVGVEKENAQRLKTARLQSQQKAQLGALNVDVGSGSAFQLQEDTATLGEADALRIRSNTLNQAEALTTQSKLLTAEGEQAQAAGRSKAIGSVLSFGAQVGSSGVADKWFTSSSSAVTRIAPGQSFPVTPTR